MEAAAAEVLIIEDDEQIQKLLIAILARGGVSSQVAGDGQAAVALLDSTKFDAVVLDLMLPRMN